ncbi:hypothetical protein H5410_011478 [Solanum commersonii]|uniref:Uncharacterized protein n=1 Tax=Solanum commersonii TaxID=4109 RepID=A0A9J6APH4_SOLCO|nr:hypothetical protein H5410_011478 [Solanum commersonii]
MDIIVVTRFHYGSKFVEDTSGGGLTYIGESEVEYIGIDKDHFSLMELLFYTRDLGVTTRSCAQSENISVGVGVDEGLQQEATQSENNVKVGVDDASYLEGVETYWDISDDSQEFAIPDDNDSEIDEELRTLRNERRTKLGFEDIRRNKADRYVGRLGGDEQYIDSSELDSDDSRDELDPEVVEGIDLPVRRKSKKIRFDPDCVVAIFELGMAEYIVEYKGQNSFSTLYKVVGNPRVGEEDDKIGLVAAIMELLPDCEQRMCARHIWSNWQKNWRGEERRKQFWRCAKSSFELRGIPCQRAVLAYQHAGQDPEDHVVHWYRKDTFMKANNYFIQPISNMKMWPHTSDIVIEPPEPKQMPGRPPKCRRKSKDEPRKKYRKLSRRGVKMTCSKCHQQGHNNKACKYVIKCNTIFLLLIYTMKSSEMGQLGSSTQPASSRQPTGYSQPPSSSVGSSQPPSSRQPRSCSQPPSSGKPVGQQSTSICDDTSIVRRVQQAGKGKERGRGKGRRRGGDETSTVTRGQQVGRGREREGASTSTRGNKRPKTVGFDIYTNDISGRQTLNALSLVSCIQPSTTGERVVTPAVFKCATPINIDIGYKPRGLKWKGKDDVTTPQLQRMSKSKGGGSANV